MKNTFYEQRCLKGTSRVEVTSTREPVSFAIVELRWSEGIRQAGSSLVS